MKPPSNAPLYACIYKDLADIARSHGYALAVHGSLSRDLDLIAVPWIENPSGPQAVIDEITNRFAIKCVGTMSLKLHGRMCQTIAFTFGDVFLDLSFMPLLPIENADERYEGFSRPL